MLESVDAGLDREPDPIQALGVGGDAEAEPVRLFDDGAELFPRQLRGADVLVGDGQRAGGHHLNEVCTLADLLPGSLAHGVGAVRFSVHARKRTTARRGRGDDLTTQHEPRPGAELELDRPP